MSETCERCYRELEPGDEKFCKWCRRYNVVSDEAWLLRRQLAAVTAERDAARAALWDARNEVVEFCAKFDIPLEHDSYLDLAVKLDEWAELAGGPPGLADGAAAE